jgi:regulation of enolase protein 1 (concanavalin A-like superfamily)
VNLVKKTPLKGRLYVEAQPYNARVRILNIAPKFHQGMALEKGQYHVEVSADNYVTQKQWIALDSGEDKHIDVRLIKKEVEFVTSGTERCDQFDNRVLASQWHWIREDRPRWSLTERPGYLRIYTQRGEIWGASSHKLRSNNLKNLLLQPAPSGDFWITTKVDFSPKYFHHAASIVIYQDDDNYIRLSRMYLSQSVQLVKEVQGEKQDIRVPVDLTTTYLKIAKKGNLYIAYYGGDGKAWTRAGEFSALLNNLRVGLYAASGLYEAGGKYGQIPADFDYFCIGAESLEKKQAKLYIASGKVKQNWPFAGGSSCCGCRIEHYGTLPNNFPRREVSAVTFYLPASRSNSYYTKIKSGPNRLDLVMGNRRASAMSRELPAVETTPVKHKWLLTFEFNPPVPAEPGMVWRLMDGDNNIYSAVLLHASEYATAADKANALPGKYKTSNCQYARTDDVWYSVKFDFVSR